MIVVKCLYIREILSPTLTFALIVWMLLVKFVMTHPAVQIETIGKWSVGCNYLLHSSGPISYTGMWFTFFIFLRCYYFKHWHENSGRSWLIGISINNQFYIFIPLSGSLFRLLQRNTMKLDWRRRTLMALDIVSIVRQCNMYMFNCVSLFKYNFNHIKKCKISQEL